MSSATSGRGKRSCSSLWPTPYKSSPMKVSIKLFILQGAVGASFFRPCLGGAQSFACRMWLLTSEVGFPNSDEPIYQGLLVTTVIMVVDRAALARVPGGALHLRAGLSDRYSLSNASPRLPCGHVHRAVQLKYHEKLQNDSSASDSDGARASVRDFACAAAKSLRLAAGQ